MKTKYKTVEQYFEMFPANVQFVLRKIRQAIHEVAPEAEETISYQMPAFRLNGILVYFAAHKNHIGFYPTASAIKAFKTELVPYKWSKGAVQFSLSQPVPLDLVKKIVAFRVKENLKRKA